MAAKIKVLFLQKIKKLKQKDVENRVIGKNRRGTRFYL